MSKWKEAAELLRILAFESATQTIVEDHAQAGGRNVDLVACNWLVL